MTGKWCDLRSMQANNCSAFNYRSMIHKTKLSYHALGLAVDINPMLNPFIKGSTVLPEGASAFLVRLECAGASRCKIV